MPTFNFDLCELPPEAQSLRAEVREFLRDALGGMASSKRALSWGGFDREFSRQLGARGWIGMMWPKKYGGHERTALERYVVLEESLAAGAPTSAHWVADRQSGPLLLRFGTEEQRQRFLPRIAKGELAFAIGMSEPDSGSDLASIRTRAERVEGGYRVNGTKIWTSNAHISDYAIALFRTKVVPDKKHEGLSQFLVDLKSGGISIRPIIDLAGGHHFNEVHFQNCFVPDDMLVGKEGDGWKQVTTELAFARGGRHRTADRAPRHAAADVAVHRGHAAGGAEPEPRGRRRQGRRHVLRAGDPRGGPRAPGGRAASRLGQPVRTHLRLPGRARAVLLAPRRHARGAARHHRPRPGAPLAMATETRSLLADTCTRLFTDQVTPVLIEAAEKGTWPAALWQALEENGLTLPQIPESRGGSGGEWADAHVVLVAAGRFAVPLPLPETMIGAWLLSASGLKVPLGPLTVAPVRPADRLTLSRDGGNWRLSGM